MARLLDNWLDSYMQYTEHSEPPELFRYWCGVSAIASCLQRKCYLVWQHGEHIYPNFYILLVGPSGSRKGTAMRQIKPLLDKIGIRCSAESITREAFIRRFAESRETSISPDGQTITTHSSFTIFSQEFTVFIGRENYRLIYDLTDIFDSDSDWTYETKHQSTDKIMGVWLNLIGATTPTLLQTTLPQEAIGGGLTGRMILVYGERGKKVPDPFMTEEDRRLQERLLADLQSVYSMSGKFTYTPDYIDKHTEWYMNSDRPNLNEQFFEGYIDRRSLHLRKLSMIMSAARSDNMIITGEDFDRALNLLIKTEHDMNKVFYGRGQSKLSAVTKRIIQYLYTHKTVTLSELLEEFWADVSSRRELDDIITILSNMNAVQVTVNQRGETVLNFVPKERRQKGQPPQQ